MSPPPLIDSLRSSPLLRLLLAFVRLGITVVSWAYLVVLGLWIAALRGIGEHHWLTGLALFLPPQGWLLPLGFLIPAQMVLRPSLLLLSLGSLGLVLGFHMRPQANEAQPWLSGTDHLALVSNNVGQRSLETLQPFLQVHHPDLLVLQECPAIDPSLVKAWIPKAYVARIGEFGVVSRHPIRAQGWVPGLGHGPGESASAAWFEVALPGQTIVVYNVHFPTPRPLLEVMKQRHPLRSLRGLAYRFTRSGRREAAAWFDRRVELHRRLREHLAGERRPFVVAGDFNLSSHGPEYRAFARAWTDTFTERGSGYGYSVPGITRNPMALRRPWLRIDYVFSGPGWEPLGFAVEPPVPAQHRALAVLFSRPTTHASNHPSQPTRDPVPRAMPAEE